MKKKNKEAFFECDEFLKYLYSNTKVKIELDTAIEKRSEVISDTALNYWKSLKPKKIDINRIKALNKNKVARIAIFEDVERLCEIIKYDNSTSNAKRVFNMLISDSSKMVYKPSELKNTPLATYMEQILNVNKEVNYLPGRSVDLSMLFDFGKEPIEKFQSSYTKKGILEGLKVLVGLGLVEAFKVIRKQSGGYETKELKKDELTTSDDILYRLSIKGCADYTNKLASNHEKG